LALTLYMTHDWIRDRVKTDIHKSRMGTQIRSRVVPSNCARLSQW